jgi:TrmH family RNA methyltransferase
LISKNQIKLIQSLKQIKFRREYGLFVAEGVKIVEELIKSEIIVKEIYGLLEWVEENQDVCEKAGIEVFRVNQKELERISNLSTPNQVLSVCEIPKWEIVDAKADQIQLALDGIRDPGNLGTIIRTADWFGVEKIVCSEDCVDVYNPKVVQATMGSIARVKVLYTELPQYLAKARADVYATVLGGESIFDSKPGKGIYIIGNESRGIRANVLQHATHRISIPSKGGAESLNASIASGIVMAIATKS